MRPLCACQRRPHMHLQGSRLDLGEKVAPVEIKQAEGASAIAREMPTKRPRLSMACSSSACSDHGTARSRARSPVGSGRRRRACFVGCPPGSCACDASCSSSIYFAMVGTSVRDKTKEASIAKMTAFAIGMNSQPDTPLRSKSGSQTMAMLNVATNVGMTI